MEIRPLSSLKPWDKNPRVVSPEALQRLQRQIVRHKIYKPLIILEDGTILGGNMRYRALQELRFTEVVCEVVYPKDEEQKIKYALSSNDNVGYTDEARLKLLITDTFPVADYAVSFGYAKDVHEAISDYYGNIKDEPAEMSDDWKPQGVIKKMVFSFEPKLFETTLKRLLKVMTDQKLQNTTEAMIYLLETHGK